jgi:hypothetical protein
MGKSIFIFLLIVISSFMPQKDTFKIIKIVDDYRDYGVMIYYGWSEWRTYKIIDTDTSSQKMALELGKSYNLLISRYDTVLKFNDGMELWNPPGSGLLFMRDGVSFTVKPDDSIKGIYFLREIFEYE